MRISPDELSFNSGQAWKTIYGHRIGAAKKSFPKDPNFYITSPNGARHVLTAIPDEDHTRQRRILTHSFSDRSLKEQEPLLKEWSHKLVRKLREVGQDTPVNIVRYVHGSTHNGSEVDNIQLLQFYNFRRHGILIEQPNYARF